MNFMKRGFVLNVMRNLTNKLMRFLKHEIKRSFHVFCTDNTCISSAYVRRD
jgi:hypothetical protein